MWLGKLSTVETVIQQAQQNPITPTEATNIQKNYGWNVQAGQKLSEPQIKTLLSTGHNPAGTKL